MPELRHHPLTDQWIVVAPERARRPSDLHVQTHGDAPERCPFCPGVEHRTGPTIQSLPLSATDPQWGNRVVANRYPALRIEEVPRRWEEGPYAAAAGFGAHEVVIETRTHDFDSRTARDEHRTFLMWRERVRDLARDQRMVHAVVFRNHGALAGATLSHPHSQIIATPVVPAGVAAELGRSAAHFAATQRCLGADLLAWEVEQAERIVRTNDQVVAYCPWASRAAFETWIVPQHHTHTLAEASDEQLEAMASATAATLAALDEAVGHPAYNLTVHTGPLRAQDPGHYRWHVRILPAILRVAGFECATGGAINPTPPEEAARWLRSALPSSSAPR